jgi:YHS domain-containing protein
MPQQGGGQMQRTDFAATPPRGYATEPSPPGRTSWDVPREDFGNANPNGSAAPGRSPQDAYGQGNFAPPTTPPANASAAFAGSPQATPPSPHATPFALDGHCPVTLVEREQWQKADPQWGAEHRGRIYLFANQAAQQQFLANPDRYSPVLSGYDLVRYAETGQLVPGRRQHGVSFEDRVYLFADEAALQRFWQSPQRYASAAYQAMNGQGMPAGVRR